MVAGDGDDSQTRVLLAGGNVVLQVYNDTAISPADLATLRLLEDSPDCHLFLRAETEAGLCDCGIINT